MTAKQVRTQLYSFLSILLMTTSLSAYACDDAKDCADCAHCAHKSGIIKALSLTGQRAEQVKTLKAEFHEKKKALRAEIKALKASHMDALSEVLTKEEMETYQAHKQAKKQCKHHDKKRGDGPSFLDKPKKCDGKDKHDHKHQ